MKEMKLHAYLISYCDNAYIDKVIRNVMVCAYDRQEAVLMLKSAPTMHIIDIKIISIQTVRKNKQNAHWFTRETYERELELTGLKGK